MVSGFLKTLNDTETNYEPTSNKFDYLLLLIVRPQPSHQFLTFPQDPIYNILLS